MKRWFLWIGVIVAIPILGVAIYLAAYFTVDPSFSATAHRLENGDYRIDIEPNFVVYSVYRVRVSDSTATLAERDDPINGDQSITIPGTLVTTETVTVTCDLVYDRPMPSITTRAKVVDLP